MLPEYWGPGQRPLQMFWVQHQKGWEKVAMGACKAQRRGLSVLSWDRAVGMALQTILWSFVFIRKSMCYKIKDEQIVFYLITFFVCTACSSPGTLKNIPWGRLRNLHFDLKSPNTTWNSHLSPKVTGRRKDLNFSFSNLLLSARCHGAAFALGKGDLLIWFLLTKNGHQ